MQNQTERLYTTSEVLKFLNLPRHRLIYLFDSRKLRVEEFPILPNGHKVYRESDIGKIRRALFEVSSK